jgi:predicted TIM-barrel fold metal-dependent hydrolase
MSSAVFLARRFPHVWLEVSGVPPARLLEYFPHLARDAKKVLFGTDWPGPGVKDIRRNLEEFRALGLPGDLQTQILETNPRVVFPDGAPS